MDRSDFMAAVAQALNEIADWIERHRRFWNARLDALRAGDRGALVSYASGWHAKLEREYARR